MSAYALVRYLGQASSLMQVQSAAQATFRQLLHSATQFATDAQGTNIDISIL